MSDNVNNKQELNISISDCRYFTFLISRLKITAIKIGVCVLIPFVIAITFGHMNIGQIFNAIGEFLSGTSSSSDMSFVIFIGLTLYLVATLIIIVKKLFDDHYIGCFFGLVIGIILITLLVSWFVGDVCFAGNFGITFSSVCGFFFVLYWFGPIVFDILSLLYSAIRFVIEYNLKKNEIQNNIETAKAEKEMSILQREKRLANSVAKLDQLIGLSQVKKEIHSIIDYYEANKKLKKHGLFDNEKSSNSHLIFLGSPGTGKTTVARLLGAIYKELGLLKRGHLVECTRKDLVGEHIGETSTKTQKVLESAIDGVLFIDEAYSIVAPNSPNDFGKEAIDTIVPFIENNRDRLVVVVAGYEREMEDFINSNSGLASRFESKIHFDDYTKDELYQIFELYAKNDSLQINDEAIPLIRDIINSSMRARDFGNARGVRKIYNKIFAELKYRMSNISLDEMTEEQIGCLSKEIISIDVTNCFSVTSDSSEEKSSSALEKLNTLIGLKSVKEQVNLIMKKVEYSKLAKQGNINVSSGIASGLHMVFFGPAGTGKTTVAKLIGEIYYDLGVLKKGLLVCCERKDLVAEYVGQTAIKTQKKIDEAIDGVLFIDEAYSLTNQSNSDRKDFGDEAIQTLITSMEDHKSDLVVIVAGYENDMNKFLDSNEGLNSRFSNKIYFENYSADEMVEIFKLLAKQERLIIAEECEHEVKRLITEKSSKKDFGNARGVRNIFNEVVSNMQARVVDSIDHSMSDDEKDTLFRTIRNEDILKL